LLNNFNLLNVPAVLE